MNAPNGGMKWATRATVIVAVAVALLMLVSILLPVLGGSGTAASTGSASIAGSEAAGSTATSAAATSSSPSSSSDSNCPNASPHCGTVYVYTIAPSGASTEDPAVLYDTVSEEPAMNVFQTLVTYAGSSVTSYVPEAATCVPGTSACTSLYGSDLIVANTTTHAPQYYTFVIGPSHFYDPSTGASWQVYPSDVLFSAARAAATFERLGVGSTGTWDIMQTLLNSNGNSSYGGGVPFNNTPAQVLLNAMLVNDSAYCPTSAMTGSSFGCITFNVNGGGHAWPFFMQAVTQVFAGLSVLPCGWYTYEDSGIPGFTTTASHGDGPCQMPGGATSSTSTAFINAVTAMGPKAWDATANLMLNYPTPWPNVQFNIVGSGPYYLATANPVIGYQLLTNPAYVQPDCAGEVGCQPVPGTYASHVLVYWEASDTVGVQEAAAGQADILSGSPSGIYQTDTATLLQLVAQGKLNVEQFPTLSIFFWMLALNFSAPLMSTILPSGATFNIPQWFFASVATRQVMVGAFPYEAYDSTIGTIDGVTYSSLYGGVIPAGMGDYTPTNITWPYNNPADSPANFSNPSIVGSAAWWFAQGTTVGSPYYNATLAACTKAHPCVFPLFGQTGAPQIDEALALFIAALEKATGGAFQPYSFDLSFPTEVAYSTSSPPGGNPMDFYTLGWIPDYPDPSNNIAAMAAANGTYTTSNSVWQTLNNGFYTSSTCSAVGQEYRTAAALAYWSNQSSKAGGGIPDACQGWAYDTMSYWMTSVTIYLSNVTERIAQYNMEENILNGLSTTLYMYQQIQYYESAPWVNSSSINTNIMIGGGADQYWFALTFLPKAYSMTFSESGLAAGTTWSVNAAGLTYTTSGSSITATLVPGTYDYTVLLVSGYKVTTPISGSVTLSTGPVTTSVGFSATTSVSYPISFLQSGVIWGTPSSLLITGAGGVTLNGGNTTLSLPTGTYDYTALAPTGYTSVSSPTGSFTVSSTGHATVSLVFKGIKFSALPVTFQLNPSGTVTSGFTATVTGYGSQVYPNSTVGSSMIFWEAPQEAVTYTATALGNTSFEYGTVSGSLTVSSNSSLNTVTLTFPKALPTVSKTFVATGLGLGATWYLAINGQNFTVSGTSINFPLPTGSYTYTVFAQGYIASPSGGTFTVSGPAAPQTFTTAFSTPTPPPSPAGPAPTFSTTAWIVIGVLAAIAVIFIALSGYFASRGRKPSSPAPPQSWDQPKGPSGGAGGSGGSSGGSGGMS